MWSRKSERYWIAHVDVDRPLAAIEIPAGHTGIAVVPRLDGRPVGFFMQELPAGARFEAERLAAAILAHSGKQILAERMHAEMRGPIDVSEFPSLDIAICTHGRPATLARCLKSLQALGLPTANVHVLVIDNAPVDQQTKLVIGQFPGVDYFLEPKPGLDFARNRALRESDAELLAYLDDDIVVDSCWLEGLREAWASNRDAGAFTGPILPLELETTAQVVFERMGGFGKNFERVRFSGVHPDSPTYPVGAGVFGAGANMVFRRSALESVRGFDDALDTGAPLPGGGDLDIFYRIVRAGYPFVREPKLVVYHQHRREYAALRHQMWTWGLGTMAYINKSWRHDREQRAKIRRWVLWWLCYQLSKIFVPFLRRNRARWPVDMVAAEIFGALVGLCGEYDRSLARVEKLRRRFV
jgi:glycosyltransferase involved in cell wall biosynthesis